MLAGAPEILMVRHFGTTYWSHLQGSSRHRRMSETGMRENVGDSVSG